MATFCALTLMTGLLPFPVMAVGGEEPISVMPLTFTWAFSLVQGPTTVIVVLASAPVRVLR